LIKKLILKKEFVILISIVIMIFSISSVSASDDLLISDDNLNETFILNSEDLTMYYKNGSRYSTQLTYDNGTAIANATIEFVINGIGYNRITDSNQCYKVNFLICVFSLFFHVV